MKKVLILENHPIALTGLSTFLQKELDQTKVFEAGDSEMALKVLEQTNIELVLISANYGIESLAIIENINSNIPIVLYYRDFKTALDVKKKHSHVQGLLSQLATPAELLKCIETISLKQSYFCDTTLRYTLEYLMKSDNDGPKKSARAASESAVNLSRREKQIHNLIVEGKGTSEIANSLNLKMSTISTVKHKILKKMKVSNVVELLRKSNIEGQGI